MTHWKIIGTGTRRQYALAQCSCGTVKEVYEPSIKSEASTSCGCQRSALKLNGRIPYSKSPDPIRRKAYNCWVNIRQRCFNKNCSNWKKYGRRGIKVAARWMNSFSNFLADMGLPPSLNHSIDRIDCSGDYTPENCRWATASEQALNKIKRKTITIETVTKTLAEWCSESGVCWGTAHSRIKRGWEFKSAIFHPPLKQWNRHQKKNYA